MTQTFRFEVEGRPAPQGSKSYRGNNRFVEASKYLPAWRSAIVSAAKQQISETPDFVIFDTPVKVEIQFYITRPNKPKFDYPATPPDLDKLVRGVFDSLTQAHIWTDDSLAVNLVAQEDWTTDDKPSGAEIKITRL
jgi:crossover junction endodeoxyribonuclease RusA